jgi:hypothetical protein
MSTLIGAPVSFSPPVLISNFLIGLCIRVRLLRSLPDRFKIDIFVKPGSHQSENAGGRNLPFFNKPISC